jgi:hypothetical protein
MYVRLGFRPLKKTRPFYVYTRLNVRHISHTSQRTPLNPKQNNIPAASKGYTCNNIINFSSKPFFLFNLKCNSNIPWSSFGAYYIFAKCTFPLNASGMVAVGFVVVNLCPAVNHMSVPLGYAGVDLYSQQQGTYPRFVNSERQRRGSSSKSHCWG